MSEFEEFKSCNTSGYLQKINDEKIWYTKIEVMQNKFDSKFADMINPKVIIPPNILTSVQRCY